MKFLGARGCLCQPKNEFINLNVAELDTPGYSLSKMVQLGKYGEFEEQVWGYFAQNFT